MSGIRWTRQLGFSLIEVLIVLVLLGILAALVVPTFQDAQTPAKVAAAAYTRQAIQLEVDIYYFKNGSYPATIEPSWFGITEIPPNPFFPGHSVTINYDATANKYHPINKAYYPDGAFWYAPDTGRFRARVAAQETDQQTLEMYNIVNQSQVEAINDIR